MLRLEQLFDPVASVGVSHQMKLVKGLDELSNSYLYLKLLFQTGVHPLVPRIRAGRSLPLDIWYLGNPISEI